MTRFKIGAGLLLLLASHLWPGGISPTHAQGTRKDDIVFNSRGTPLAGATVRVCAMPASGQPCTPLALLYSDVGLTQAIANPTTADGMGNYFFYAAAGKYEIEISGPGITTKQIPNVVLPNDPSSPTFSGAITAFSLNLSGNLTVTGNTTVIGSLASGTLNLTNQASPPGAASAGTVNLYAKTSDKRLYYKDDTGIEIGPIASGSGAQTNVVNTFTATQNFDSDFQTKGPNPYFSLARYGGYSSATSTPPSTTGSITAATTTLTLASQRAGFCQRAGHRHLQSGTRDNADHSRPADGHADQLGQRRNHVPLSSRRGRSQRRAHRGRHGRNDHGRRRNAWPKHDHADQLRANHRSRNVHLQLRAQFAIRGADQHRRIFRRRL